jgi:MFS family permease
MMAGILSDKVGAYNIFVTVCIFAGILVLGLWIPATGNAAIIVFACLFGFASGAYVSLATALVVKISPFPEIGYRSGLLFLFSSIGGLATNPIAGAILAHYNGSYKGMKVFAGVLLLVGSVSVMATRFYATGFVLKAKF